jgi:hypothetical protein
MQMNIIAYKSGFSWTLPRTPVTLFSLKRVTPNRAPRKISFRFTRSSSVKFKNSHFVLKHLNFLTLVLSRTAQIFPRGVSSPISGVPSEERKGRKPRQRRQLFVALRGYTLRGGSSIPTETSREFALFVLPFWAGKNATRVWDGIPTKKWGKGQSPCPDEWRLPFGVRF